MAWYNPFTTKSAHVGDTNVSNSAQLLEYMTGGSMSNKATLSPYSPRTNIAVSYRDNVIGHLCADLIAQNAGRIDLFVKINDEEVRETTNPIAKRLQRPNPKTSKARFIQQIVYDLVLTGNAYILRNEVKGSRNNGKGEWWVLPSRSVTVRTDTKGTYPDGFQYNQSNGRVVVYPCDPDTGESEVLHLTNYNPLDDYVGLPSAVASLRSLEIFSASEEYNFTTLKTGGIPKLIAFFKDFANGQTRGMTKEQKMQVGESLKNFMGPNRKSDILITQGDLEFKELQTTPKDMEFIQAQQEASRNIARAFGVPAILLGIPGDNTYSNQEQALVALFTNRIIPLVDYIVDELTNWMSPIWGTNVIIEYDVDSIDQLAAHNRQKWEAVKGIDWLTNDEKREMFGFAPLATPVEQPTNEQSLSNQEDQGNTLPGA